MFLVSSDATTPAPQPAPASGAAVKTLACCAPAGLTGRASSRSPSTPVVACSLYNALTIDIENWRMNSCPPLRVCFPIDLDLDPDFSTRVDYLACARLGYVDGEYEVEWGGMKRLLIMTVVL